MKIGGLVLGVLWATIPAAFAQQCLETRLVGKFTHVENEKQSSILNVYSYGTGNTRAVVVEQDMRVDSDGALRSYQLQNHGLSYLCDGLGYRKQDGSFSSGAGCSAAAATLETFRSGNELVIPANSNQAFCIFAFFVAGGDSSGAHCSGTIVGGSRAATIPLDVSLKDGNGVPLAHFISTTSVKNSRTADGAPAVDGMTARELDATEVPYIVRPSDWPSRIESASGSADDAAFSERDYAYVFGAAGGSRSGVFALVGDGGPHNKFGEGSLALHQFLRFGQLFPPPPFVSVPGRPHPQPALIKPPYVDRGDGDIRALENIDRRLLYVMFPDSAVPIDSIGGRHTFRKGAQGYEGNVQEGGVRAAAKLGGIDNVLACLRRTNLFTESLGGP